MEKNLLLKQHDETTSASTMVDIANRFFEAVEAFDFNACDNLQPLLKILPHIRMRNGYVLDCYWKQYILFDNITFSDMKLYAHQSGASEQYFPYKQEVRKSLFGLLRSNYINKDIIIPYSDNMIINGPLPFDASETIPSFLNYVELEFLPLAIWEAYLLDISEAYLPKRRNGHGIYRNQLIYSYETLKAVCPKGVNCEMFLNDKRLKPSVTLKSDTEALITYCSWSHRGGDLSYVTISAQKNNCNVKFNRISDECLLESGGGLIF